LPPKRKQTEIKEEVLRYIADHRGEIDIAKCAKDFGLSEAEVIETIGILQGAGRIEKEKVIPPPKLAPRKKPTRVAPPSPRAVKRLPKEGMVRDLIEKKKKGRNLKIASLLLFLALIIAIIFVISTPPGELIYEKTQVVAQGMGTAYFDFWLNEGDSILIQVGTNLGEAFNVSLFYENEGYYEFLESESKGKRETASFRMVVSYDGYYRLKVTPVTILSAEEVWVKVWRVK